MRLYWNTKDNLGHIENDNGGFTLKEKPVLHFEYDNITYQDSRMFFTLDDTNYDFTEDEEKLRIVENFIENYSVPIDLEKEKIASMAILFSLLMYARNNLVIDYISLGGIVANVSDDVKYLPTDSNMEILELMENLKQGGMILTKSNDVINVTDAEVQKLLKAIRTRNLGINNEFMQQVSEFSKLDTLSEIERAIITLEKEIADYEDIS